MTTILIYYQSLSTDYGFRGLGSSAARDSQNPGWQSLKHSFIRKLNNSFVFYVLQVVIKMVRRGCRGSPRTPFQRDAALPGHELPPLTSLTNHAYLYANKGGRSPRWLLL